MSLLVLLTSASILSATRLQAQSDIELVDQIFVANDHHSAVEASLIIAVFEVLAERVPCPAERYWGKR